MKILIILSALATLGFTKRIIFPSDNDSDSRNKTCRIKNSGLPGECVPYSSCKSAQTAFIDHKIQPTRCSFNGNESIVCCSDIIEADQTFENCRKSKISK